MENFNNNLIQISLNYYDITKKKFYKFYKKKDKNYIITHIKILEKPFDLRFEFFNNTHKLLSCKKVYIGKYNKNTNIFIWSWGYNIISEKNNNNMHLFFSKKIINYILETIAYLKSSNKKEEYDNMILSDLLRKLFLQYKLKITYKIEFDLLLAILLYLFKGKFYLIEKDKNNINWYDYSLIYNVKDFNNI